MSPAPDPYACSCHPGMTGAAIVGDGVGAGNVWIAAAAIGVPIELAGPLGLVHLRRATPTS